MDVLLSIRPQYVAEIYAGRKRFEFRKRAFKPCRRVWIYESAPTMRVTGWFEPGKPIEAHPEWLWREFEEWAGIERKPFFAYFSGREKGFAIPIKRFERIEPINPKDIFNKWTAPQSHIYLTN